MTTRPLTRRPLKREGNLGIEENRYANARQWALRNRWELLAVALLTAVAAFLRVYGLEDTPAGFHGDEAWTGLEGMRILKEGWIGPYTTSGLGQPTGPFYLTALALWLFGPSIFTVRLSMALFGIATVPMSYLLLRVGFGRWVALFGATALTVSHWHLHYSRLGFGLISLPFAAALAAVTLLWALRSASPWRWLAAGACLGLLPYTYFAFPAFLAAEAGTVAVYFLLRRDKIRRTLIYHLGLFVAAALLVASPVVYATLEYPAAYFGRLRGVSSVRCYEYADPGGTEKGLWECVRQSLGLFWMNERNDGADGTAAGRGALNFGVAVLAYIGLAVCFKRWRSPPHLFTALAIVSILAALMVTDPSSGTLRRSIGAIPWVFGAAGVGAATIAGLMRRLLGEIGRVASLAGVALVLVGGGVSNLHYYFIEHPKNPVFRNTFSANNYLDALAVAHSFGNPNMIYFYSDRAPFVYETIRFLYPESQGLDRSKRFGEFGLERLHSGTVTYVLLDRYVEEIDAIRERYPDGELIVGGGDPPAFIVYFLRGGRRPFTGDNLGRTRTDSVQGRIARKGGLPPIAPHTTKNQS